MRKLIVAEHISLDGVIQAPGGPEEDPSGDFRLGGWILPYADKGIGQAVQDLLASHLRHMGAVLAARAGRPRHR